MNKETGGKAFPGEKIARSNQETREMKRQILNRWTNAVIWEGV